VAILLVVLLHYTPFHFNVDQLERGLGFLSFVPRTGWTGVTLFFVLSAFLLSQPFWREHAGGKQPSISTFYSRRVLRIVPLFYVAVLVAYLGVGDGWAAIRSLLFLPDNGLLHPFSNVWWSLRTEAQFYFLLGLCAWLVRKPRWRPVLVSCLALYGVCYLGFVLGVFGSFGFSMSKLSGDVLFSLAHQWPAFAFGMLISWLYVNWGQTWRQSAQQTRWLARGGGDAVMLLVLIALGATLTSVESVNFFEMLRTHGLWPLLESLLWASFVLALLLLPLRTHRVFVNAPLEFFGRISYSLYLIHLPLNNVSAPLRHQVRLAVFGQSEPSPWIAGASMAFLFAMAVGLSWITYRCIEKPFVSLKTRIAG
jgi:peptidoglycan/LPS O-acetylase OafA/YrhL